jgi:hypothetical protein
VAAAIQHSPDANSTLKNSSCTFGGAARSESGGNTCERNSSNFGVLQLNQGNLPAEMTAEQYLILPLQRQVDIWAQQVGNSNTTGGYATLANTQQIGGTAVTPGMMAACFQFGPAICRNDIAFMQQNGGACPSVGSGGININTLPRSRWGEANLDGGNQSICSWGQNIQANINKAAAGCTNANCSIDNVGDFPTSSVPEPVTTVIG